MIRLPRKAPRGTGMLGVQVAGALMAAALPGCAPFGPNASGRWLGTLSCPEREPVDLVLALVEEAGSTGEITGQLELEDFNITPVVGRRTDRKLRLEWAYVRWEPCWIHSFQGELDGDELRGPVTLTEECVELRCDVQLDR